MLLSWALSLSTVFLVPAFGTPQCAVCGGSSDTNALYTASVLESLHCHNDYKSHIRCSWTESRQMHQQAPLSLYHWNSIRNRESPCVPYGRPEQLLDGRFTVRCQYNTSLFALAISDSFFFKMACPPALRKELSPLQHVRLGPPRNLWQRAVEGGGSVLRWQDPPYTSLSRPHASLNYQVCYRRRGGRAWTEVEVSELELKIEADSLVSGCEYEAKVRVREDKGLWSEWSPLVEWRTEDVPSPPRLQCVFDGQAEVRCSWEVKRELAQFITYRLSYRLNQSFPVQWCSKASPLDAQRSRDPVLQFSCSFSVSDPRQRLAVELIPTYNSKEILSHQNIQPSRPDPVSVTERDQGWVLSWTPPESMPAVSYELRYWSPEKQDSKEYNLTEGARFFVISGHSLRPSTLYRAQVRTRVIPMDSFMGPPSEWSEWREWKSNPAPWSMEVLIYTCIAVLVGITFIILYFTLPACRRRIVLWKVSVPTPIKSKVLEEIMKRSPSAKPSLQKETEKTLICNLQVLGKAHSSCYLDDCGQPLASANDSDPGPCLGTPPKPAAPGPSTPPEESALSFSGPYILCRGPYPPGAGEAEEEAPTGDFLSDTPGSAQPPPPTLCQRSGGYVSTPTPSAGPGEDSALGPSQEAGPLRNGYLTDPSVLMRAPQPKPSPGMPDCAPPAYTASPVPLQGGPGGCPAFSEGPAGGQGAGPANGRGAVTDYVRLSEQSL